MSKITGLRELKKHVGTVEISNPLSLIQRKAFNILYHNAYPNMGQAAGLMNEIPMKAFCELLGFDSKNFAVLDKQIKKLQTTIIEWIDNPDEFGRVSFFSYTGRKAGQFRYRFDPELEKKLYHPELYARINILSLSLFKSRYAIALYENLARYRPNKSRGFPGGSPVWEMAYFRELMGLGTLYKDLRDLQKRVIFLAVEEINEVSDLKVTYRPIKTGKNITHLKFLIEDNTQQSLALIPEPQSIESETTHELVMEMQSLYGVPLMKGAEWIIQYGEGRFNQILEMTAEKIENSNLKNPIGFITKAFEENWKPGNASADAKKKLEARRVANAASKKEERLAKARKVRTTANEQKALRIEFLRSWIEKQTARKKTEIFEAYFDDSIELFPGHLPISRGESGDVIGKGVVNETCRDWFFNFIEENYRI